MFLYNTYIAYAKKGRKINVNLTKIKSVSENEEFSFFELQSLPIQPGDKNENKDFEHKFSFHNFAFWEDDLMPPDSIYFLLYCLFRIKMGLQLQYIQN